MGENCQRKFLRGIHLRQEYVKRVSVVKNGQNVVLSYPGQLPDDRTKNIFPPSTPRNPCASGEVTPKEFTPEIWPLSGRFGRHG